MRSRSPLLLGIGAGAGADTLSDLSWQIVGRVPSLQGLVGRSPLAGARRHGGVPASWNTELKMHYRDQLLLQSMGMPSRRQATRAR